MWVMTSIKILHLEARLHGCVREVLSSEKPSVLVMGSTMGRHGRGRQLKMRGRGASLVAQWLRICLPMQGTWVRALVWEDPTCRGATRPVSHNY